jgi:hypothetical protein
MPVQPGRILAAILLWFILAPWAMAQVSDVTVDVDPSHVGLGGAARPGGWTPMLVTLRNAGASHRKVRCQWVVDDADGDPVQYERLVTLSPSRDEPQRVWLYAAPPYDTDLNRPDWTVQVIDDQTGELLARQRVTVSRIVDRNVSFIGITGSRAMGLMRFSDNVTQHERIDLLRSLNPDQLPDRWVGFDQLGALIWTPDTADPASVWPETLRAIRQWVRRGGHLVVILPSFGDDRWMNSPLGDIMPRVSVTTKRDVLSPPALGKLTRIDYRVLEPIGDATVIAAEPDVGPWIVARRVGFGRVTMIGVDLTDGRLRDAGLPDGMSEIWNMVFGWRNRNLATQIERAKANPRNIQPRAVDSSGFIRGLITMSDTFAGALTLAILVFVVYWLAAGPVGFAVLKLRGATRHAWTLFVAMVVLFSAICWGGALLLRPSDTRVAHVSVMDIDGVSGEVHVHSWLSLFVARHGEVDIALQAGDGDANRDAIWAPGLPAMGFDEGTFLDPRRYTVDSASPRALRAPFRSTAKQLELDYLGRMDNSSVIRADQWVFPQPYRMRIESGFPVGSVSHGMPGALRQVMVVYCPGEGDMPWVWRQTERWEPNQQLEIARPPVDRISRLIVRGGDETKWSGYLPDTLIDSNNPLGRLDTDMSGSLRPKENELIGYTELLTFYSMLPPPPWWETGFTSQPTHYYRPAGRNYDMTHLLAFRGIVLIGYMRNAPLPAPLTVDGEPVPGEGWTVVRWIYPM